MKVLTVKQPYASLIAEGFKRYETRSWNTHHRGDIAIHSGTGDMFRKLDGKTQIAIIKALGEDVTGSGNYGLMYDTLARGAIIAVAEIEDCWQVERTWQGAIGEGRIIEFGAPGRGGIKLYKADLEFAFGDFTPGRYAWELTNVRKLKAPIPFKGAQGLWNVPEDVERLIKEQL